MKSEHLERLRPSLVNALTDLSLSGYVDDPHGYLASWFSRKQRDTSPNDVASDWLTYIDVLNCEAMFVWWFFIELNLPFYYEEINGNQAKTTWFKQLNPYATSLTRAFPVLLDRSTQTTIFDSNAIVRYVSEKIGARTWYGPGRIDAVLEWTSSVLLPAIADRLVYPQILSIQTPSHNQHVDSKATEEVDGLLSLLEGWLGEWSYVAGPEPSVADISVFTKVVLLELVDSPRVKVRYDSSLIAYQFPSVHRWMNEMKSRRPWHIISNVPRGFADLKEQMTLPMPDEYIVPLKPLIKIQTPQAVEKKMKSATTNPTETWTPPPMLPFEKVFGRHVLRDKEGKSLHVVPVTAVPYMLRTLGQPLSDDDAKSIIAKWCDRNGDTSVDFNHFIRFSVRDVVTDEAFCYELDDGTSLAPLPPLPPRSRPPAPPKLPLFVPPKALPYEAVFHEYESWDDEGKWTGTCDVGHIGPMLQGLGLDATDDDVANIAEQWHAHNGDAGVDLNHFIRIALHDSFKDSAVDFPYDCSSNACAPLPPLPPKPIKPSPSVSASTASNAQSESDSELDPYTQAIVHYSLVDSEGQTTNLAPPDRIPDLLRSVEDDPLDDSEGEALVQKWTQLNGTAPVDVQHLIRLSLRHHFADAEFPYMLSSAALDPLPPLPKPPKKQSLPSSTTPPTDIVSALSSDIHVAPPDSVYALERVFAAHNNGAEGEGEGEGVPIEQVPGMLQDLDMPVGGQWDAAMSADEAQWLISTWHQCNGDALLTLNHFARISVWRHYNEQDRDFIYALDKPRGLPPPPPPHAPSTTGPVSLREAFDKVAGEAGMVSAADVPHMLGMTTQGGEGDEQMVVRWQARHGDRLLSWSNVVALVTRKAAEQYLENNPDPTTPEDVPPSDAPPTPLVEVFAMWGGDESGFVAVESAEIILRLFGKQSPDAIEDLIGASRVDETGTYVQYGDILAQLSVT
mmetsp:Transcript_32027/g.51737  ORF Transcript_32027/g.51737 Transcript_32027/m.51737 type:complete len:959 (+) Transcript_32027:133-3009(+)